MTVSLTFSSRAVYTSGTTGLPKGVVRSAGGHAVGMVLSMRHLFSVHGPGDVQFTASDIGWVVGHSYIVYAPLLGTYLVQEVAPETNTDFIC
jgi:acyl-coenzyme A synthetase/AMP-(fatty) acid ligase